MNGLKCAVKPSVWHSHPNFISHHKRQATPMCFTDPTAICTKSGKQLLKNGPDKKKKRNQHHQIDNDHHV